MYFLETEHSFDSAHFLKGYDGKCSNIHGHHWRVTAQIASEDLSEERQTRGMIMDFNDFKRILRKLTREFDHTLIIEKDSLRPATKDALIAEGFSMKEVDFRPTAENFAAYFYRRLTDTGLPVVEVSVYETPKNRAVFKGDV